MENHSSVTGHQGSRLLKRVWMGEAGGGGEYKFQLSVRVRVRLSVK